MADIVLENIDLVYHGQPQTTLSGINLTIPDNGITVILGASGCGKTSLLNIVAVFNALRRKNNAERKRHSASRL